MQSTARITVSLFLLTSACVNAYNNNDAKLRRNGMLNLYPFPRVGRADPKTWQVPLNDFNLGEWTLLPHIDPRYRTPPRLTPQIADYDPMEKRQMYAFPRVGRSDASLRDLFRSEQLLPVPIRRSNSPAMWFGPRLGRAVKSHDDGDLHQDHIQNNNNGYGMWFGPRVGRSAKTDDSDMAQNDDNERSEPEQVEPNPMDRKKRAANPL